MRTPTPVRVSLEEYLALPETTVPHELVNGELRVTAAPSPWHQTVLNRIARALEDFVEARGLGLVFRAPVDVLLDPRTPLALQPDITFVRRHRAEIVRERIEGAPDLVIEVLSPGTREYDRTEKSARYAAAGVTEYWLADLEARTIEVRRLDQRPPVIVDVFTVSDTLTSPLLQGFALSIRSVFTQ